MMVIVFLSFGQTVFILHLNFLNCTQLFKISVYKIMGCRE